MKILAIDTATEACSAALYLGGEVLQRYQVEPRGHSRLILPMMQALLDESGVSLTALDGLAFGRGPGSFTGLRIAAGVIQGAALGADLPVAPISTLATLARAYGETPGVDGVLAAIDARMGEIYWGSYRATGQGLVLEGVERVLSPDRVQAPKGRWLGVGTGWGTHGEVLAAGVGSALLGCRGEALPQAADVARLAAREGTFVAAELALPVYLRDRVAKKIGE